MKIGYGGWIETVDGSYADTVRLVLFDLSTSYVREEGRMVPQEQHSQPGSKCQQRAAGLPESVGRRQTRSRRAHSHSQILRV